MYKANIVLLIAVAFVGIVIAAFIMIDDPRNVPKKTPSCIDCVAWCAPFKVTKCIPSGLGPKCECTP